MTTGPARWLRERSARSFGVAIGDLTDAFGFAPVLLAFAGVGTVVASRRPANPIGWLFLAEGLAFAVGVATDTYARYATSGSVTPPAAEAVPLTSGTGWKSADPGYRAGKPMVCAASACFGRLPVKIQVSLVK